MGTPFAKSTLLAALVALAAACNQSSFKGSADKGGDAATPSGPTPDDPSGPTPPPPGSKTETFNITGRKGKIDMVWVVDNSLSMKEEAAIVRDNFDSFVETLSNRTDIKLALIAFGEGKDATKLSDALLSDGHLQVSSTVASTNPMALAAAASCPEASTEDYQAYAGTEDGRMKLCDQTIDSRDFAAIGPLEDAVAVEKIRGGLEAFYRPDTRKVFVFVTDDNAAFVTEQNFLQLVEPRFAGQTVGIYAFMATSESKCSTSAVGLAYATLAKKTGGLTFDVCAENWDDHYEKLTNSIASALTNVVTIDGKVGSVVEVRIDGETVPADKYTVTGNVVEIDKALLAKEASSVEVVYQPAD